MKSIEELAREFVKEIEVRKLDSSRLKTFLMTCPQYSALKSALEKPVEKEQEWPKYFQSNNGGVIRFDSEAIRGTWDDGFPSIAWHYGTVIKSKNFRRIPTAEALAIIEKAKK